VIGLRTWQLDHGASSGGHKFVRFEGLGCQVGRIGREPRATCPNSVGIEARHRNAGQPQPVFPSAPTGPVILDGCRDEIATICSLLALAVIAHSRIEMTVFLLRVSFNVTQSSFSPAR